MKRIMLVLAAVTAGCQSGQAPVSADGGKPRAAAPARPESAGRFFARAAAGAEHELALRKLTVDVTRRPGTVHSHLVMEVAAGVEGQSEALIRLPVPRGAAVTNAVLWVNDKPMRGAFVERQRARDIYTSIVVGRRDPALVTWDGPGWIAVSIFPLEKNRPRRFELDWIEPAAEVDGRVMYRAPVISEGDRVVGRASISVDGRRLRGASEDLIALGPADPRRFFTRQAPGDPFQQVMVREADATGAPHFVLCAETSAAMIGGDRARQRAVLDSLFAELPADAKLTLLAADWDVSPIVEEASRDAWAGALAKLDGIPSAGTLHLERALRESAARARRTGAAAVLFVGRGEDGFVGDAVSGPLAELQDARVRVSVVGTGAGDVPRPLVRATIDTGGEASGWRTFADARAPIIDALRPRPGRPGADARGEGEWHLLRTITGGAVWMGRTLTAETAADGEIARAEAGSPLAADLAALWDRARLEWNDRDAADDVAKVLTPVTSLLVLETEQDYRRFGLDVPAPVAVAHGGTGTRHKGEQGRSGAVGFLGGIAREDTAPRAQLLNDTSASAEPPRAEARDVASATPAPGSGRSASAEVNSIFSRDVALGMDAQAVLGGLIGPQAGQAYGVGGLGAVGTGAGGGGTGERTLGLGGIGTLGTVGKGGKGGELGGRRARAPDVVPEQANVRGSLDKEIVRRIIRRHVNEVRFCYDQGLLRQPNLGGRLVAQFTIAASGQVLASVVQSSTLGRPSVESCIVSAIKRWEFPKPAGGGLAIVSYPFVFRPGDARAEAVVSHAPPELRPIDEALATLAQGAEAPRIERIASLLGLRRVSSAEALAWTVPRRGADFETHLLVARLLERSKRHRDAVRVLIEAGAAALPATAAELGAIGAETDAAELLRLAKR